MPRPEATAAPPVFKEKRSRALIPVLVVVVILAGAWVGGWFWLARWVDRAAADTLEKLSRRGVDVNCENRSVTGFPFALKVTCGDTAVAERTSATKASFAGVTGGASVFAPMTANVSMASPAHVDSPQLGTADMRWQHAGLGVGLGMNGPRDVSFDTASLEADIAVPRLPLEKIAAASATGMAAPSPNGGTDLSGTFTDLRVTTGGAELPPVSGTASGELSVPPRALLAGRPAIHAPVWARGIDIALESGGAKFHVAGDISVDAEGIVDGELTLRVGGAESLPAVIAALPEAWQKLGNAVAGGLFAFGKATTLDGKPASELTIEISRGDAKIGPIEFTLPKVKL
jgi:hypothetical protein